MEPNYPFNQSNRSGRLRGVGVLIIVVILACMGFAIYKAVAFHIVSTDPSLSAFPTVATDMTVFTNKQLAAKSLSIYDPGGIISRSQVSGKTIVFTFNVTLQANKKYEFFITSIESQSGDKLSNQSVSFTAQNIPFDKLSPRLQKQVLSTQDKYAYSVGNINWAGFDNLINQGLTSGEVEDIKSDIFDYTNKLKKQYQTIPMISKSLSIYFHDPSTKEAYASSATFTITLGNSNYKVRSEYDGISDVTYTRIYNSSGAVVYDSSAQ